jgi:chaperonin cofactor prefoldin
MQNNTAAAHTVMSSASVPCCVLQICDEQAAELRRAEEQLSAVEAALQQRTSQLQQLQARVSELESEVESNRHEQRTFGSAIAAKERDHVRRIESLQDEVEHQQEQMAAVEKLLRERAAQLNELKEKVGVRVNRGSCNTLWLASGGVSTAVCCYNRKSGLVYCMACSKLHDLACKTVRQQWLLATAIDRFSLPVCYAGLRCAC